MNKHIERIKPENTYAVLVQSKDEQLKELSSNVFNGKSSDVLNLLLNATVLVIEKIANATKDPDEAQVRLFEALSLLFKGEDERFNKIMAMIKKAEKDVRHEN